MGAVGHDFWSHLANEYIWGKNTETTFAIGGIDLGAMILRRSAVAKSNLTFVVGDIDYCDSVPGKDRNRPLVVGRRFGHHFKSWALRQMGVTMWPSVTGTWRLRCTQNISKKSFDGDNRFPNIVTADYFFFVADGRLATKLHGKLSHKMMLLHL